jgi:hypothetical protein
MKKLNFNVTLPCRAVAPEMIPVDVCEPNPTPVDAYNNMVDVYAFAITVWELAASERPYSNVIKSGVGPKTKSASEAVLLDMVKKHTHRPGVVPREFGDAFGKLLNDCWNQDPAGRPPFEKIVV